MQRVLSIAGSDPTGGAGLQADLQVFHAFGVHGASVPTALTTQNGLRIRQVLPVFPSAFLEQLRTTLDTIQPAAIKIGMLATDDIVRNTLLALAPLSDHADRELPPPIVIDPILAASDGTSLLEKRAYPALMGLAQGQCLLTPNWPEMEILTGASLPRRRDGEQAARELLQELKLGGILLKGGHLEGNADDLFVTRLGDRHTGKIVIEWFAGERLPGAPVHGTGCALSAAIAAGLGKGASLRDSILEARAYVHRGIRHAHDLPNGARMFAF